MRTKTGRAKKSSCVGFGRKKMSDPLIWVEHWLPKVVLGMSDWTLRVLLHPPMAPACPGWES